MSEKRATREAYGETLIELVNEGHDIVVLDADLAKSTTTGKFAKVYPERFLDVGIAEQNMIGIAAGLSMTGKTAFASSFGCFVANRAIDQIRVQVCYGNLNVKVVGTHGGISVGEDGASHQAMEEVATMSVLPNMTVFVPCDYVEAKKVVRAAALDVPGPAYIRLGREKFPIITSEDTPFVVGRAVTMRLGGDVTIIASGALVCAALDAAVQLAGSGVDARVLDIHTVKPIDAEAVVAAAKETGAIVTAEESQVHGGLGGAVAEVVCR